MWTPAAGKKYRLLGFYVILPIGSTTAAALTFNLADSGGLTIFSGVISTAALAALTSPILIPFQLPFNGFLSPLVNNRLVCALSTAMTAGEIDVNVWGTEE